MKLNTKLSWIKLLFILCFAAFLSACSTPTAQVKEVTRVAQQTVLVPQTIVVTKIVEVIITATPIHATATPEVTVTPQYTVWNSSEVVSAFKAAGLEAEETYAMTKDDYGLAPYVAIEGTRFFIPSLCADCGGRIMSFASQSDLDIAKAYYDELGRASAAFFSWTFVKDNILVQINGKLSEEKANEYKAALETLGK